MFVFGLFHGRLQPDGGQVGVGTRQTSNNTNNQPRRTTPKEKVMDIKDFCKIVEMLEGKSLINDTGPWEIGKKYFIRTVTMSLTGELISVTQQELVLKNAAWIADSGRFHKAVEDPKKCSEVEPFRRNVIVGRGAIVDATEITHVITEVK